MSARFLYAIALLLSLWAGGTAMAQTAKPCKPTANYKPVAERTTNALLYEVRRCGYPRSYLMGTFHSDSPKLESIYQLATSRLQHTQQLALEVVLTDDMRAQVRRMLLVPTQAKNLKERISKKEYKLLKAKLLPLLDMTPKEVERHKLWAIAVLSQYPKAEADGVVLDEKLQRYAESWGMKVLNLETPVAQLSIFDRMPEKLQKDFLASTIDDADTLEDQHKELKEDYIAHDIAAIYAMSERLFSAMEKNYPDLSHYLKDNVLTRRNSTMTRRITPLLQTSSFVAVGALHLPGPDGILVQLEKQGFEIWPVKSKEDDSASALY